MNRTTVLGHIEANEVVDIARQISELPSPSATETAIGLLHILFNEVRAQVGRPLFLSGAVGADFAKWAPTYVTSPTGRFQMRVGLKFPTPSDYAETEDLVTSAISHWEGQGIPFSVPAGTLAGARMIRQSMSAF